MRLTWRQMALKDRMRIMDHIAQDNPAAAIELDETFGDKSQARSTESGSLLGGQIPRNQGNRSQAQLCDDLPRRR